MLQLDGNEFFFHLQDKEDNAIKICQEFNDKILAIQALIPKIIEPMDMESLSDELLAITLD